MKHHLNKSIVPPMAIMPNQHRDASHSGEDNEFPQIKASRDNAASNNIILDPTTISLGTWTKCELRGRIDQLPQCGFAASSTTGKNGEIYIFGGATGAYDTPVTDLFVIDPCTVVVCETANEIVRAAANPLQTKGKQPLPRFFAASALVDDKLIGNVLGK
jgi:hypothetical protein